MQSFPHQISDLDKLYRALKVIGGLIAITKDVSNDEVLGVALAEAGVYTFRGAQSLAEALQKEKEKKRANRGTETAARDLRRLFSLMNLIEKSEEASGYVLTEMGHQLLASTAGAERQGQWRNAMLSLTLETGTSTYSHPYRILARLVSSVPGIEKQKLMLALEPTDDSEAEFGRIMGLAKQAYPDIVQALGVSESNAANSIKILPSIAQQLGDIVDKSGKSFPAPVTVVTEEGTLTAPKEITTASKIFVEVTPESIAESPAFTEGGAVTVDLTSAIAVRKKRTIDHNKAVKSLASVLHDAKFKLYEFPFDCLAVGAGNRVILAEVKTLDGSQTDERQQSARALGQLKGYHYFSLTNEHKEGVVIELAAFTMRPSEPTIAFLRQAGVAVTWLENEVWKFISDQGSVVDFEPGSLF